MEGYGRYRSTVADAGSMMGLAAQTFVGHRRCALTPLQAWHALAEFDQWLTALPTVTAVHVETHGPLLQIGTEYTVKTPEGPTLRARVTEVEALRRVHTTARLWLFRSELDCEIVPLEDGVQLVRRQTYPGLIGALWALIARKRERQETEAYLDLWSQWASRTPSTPTTPAVSPGSFGSAGVRA